MKEGLVDHLDDLPSWLPRERKPHRLQLLPKAEELRLLGYFETGDYKREDDDDE